MSALVVLVIIFAALFALAYITKRRFGVLGLALCAGSLLSTSWAHMLTPWIESQGVVLVSPPLSAVVGALLILAPPILLLFGGPTYSNGIQRIAGSLAFALLALTFLLGPLGSALLLDPTGYQLYSFLTKSSNTITVIGIIAALADIIVTRTPKRGSK